MWMGKSYRMYLRDRNKINEQNNMYLIDSNIDNQIQTLSDKDREVSGEYCDGD